MESYKNAENKINAIKLDGIDEKSWWEKLGDIADVVGDSLKGFGLGVYDAVASTVEGLAYVVTHPIETLEGLAYVVTHLDEALPAMWDAIVESWDSQVINGDAESRGKFFGRAFGEVALAVVGTKGVDKAVKAAKGTKIVQEASKGYKVIKSDVANKVGNVKVPVRVRQEVLATPDGRKFSMWNVETKPARELYQKFAVKGTGENISHPVLDNTRSGSALKKPDGQHGFNDIIDNYTPHAKEFEIVGGDGVNRKLYQIEGGMKYHDYKDVYNKELRINERITTVKGQNGIFEWIVDPTEGVTHRRFIPNGKITGFPNQRP